MYAGIAIELVPHHEGGEMCTYPCLKMVVKLQKLSRIIGKGFPKHLNPTVTQEWRVGRHTMPSHASPRSQLMFGHFNTESRVHYAYIHSQTFVS